MNNLLDTSFDSVLKPGKVEDHLVWLPWVGKEYAKADRKILIIGESHYTTADDLDSSIIDIKKMMDNPNFTRRVIEVMGILNLAPTIFFKNIYKTLLGPINFTTGKLWEHVAFYNFIQRPLRTKIKERPTKEDYAEGWCRFNHAVRVLDPDICLFIGVGAANTAYQTLQELDFNYVSEPVKGPKINRTFPRTMTIMPKDKYIKMIFTLHASRMFSPPLWREYLKTEMSVELDYLERKVIQ